VPMRVPTLESAARTVHFDVLANDGDGRRTCAA